MSIESSIEDRIISILAAETDFDGVNLFINGVALQVPAQYYPFCEVDIMTSTTPNRYTGQHRVVTYSGQIRFFGRYQDTLTVTGRLASIPSYLAVKTYINNTELLFETATNRVLNNLSGTGWVVQQFNIGNRQYGFTERGTAFDNFGTLEFDCLVNRST